MQITKFKKMSGGKYKVFFNNKSTVLIHEDIILKYNLISSKYLDSDTFDEVINENNRYLVYDLALKYIEIKLRCESEIRDYLKKKNIEKDLIDMVILKLKDNGFLNDNQYIRSYIYDKININKLGPNKIKRELINLGFDENDINLELSEIDENLMLYELDKLITKRINQSKNCSGNVLKQKLLTYFIDRGYNKEDILSIIDTKKLYDDELLKKEYDKLYNKYSKKYSGDKLTMIIKQKLYQKGFYYNEI